MKNQRLPASDSVQQPSAGQTPAANLVAQALGALQGHGAWPADAIEVGRIGGAWGVKGWVKLQAFSNEPEALLAARHWLVQPTERGAKLWAGHLSLKVAHIRPHSDVLVAQLDGVADRDVADALKGARIFVLRSDFPALDDEDEFYWVDLIGLDVINREGVALGVVKELLSNGPQSVLVITRAQQTAPEAPAADIPVETKPRKASGSPGEILIPFVDAYVDKVSLAEKRITVDWQPDYV